LTQPYPEAARALLRDTLLDAAGALLADRPWSKVSMGEVARRAGVSRQTLYNELGGRPELAEAYVLREAGRLLAAVREAIEARADDPREALRGAFERFLVLARDTPMVRAIVADDGSDGLLPLVTTQGGAVIGFAGDGLAEVLRATWPGVPAADARRLADAVVRLAISHAARPAGPPNRTAADLATLLGPHVEAVVGAHARRRAA
jgi:AcrR family transcriptional regulator